MAYSKQTWNDTSAGGTPISATRLNYMETGIQDAAADADTAASNASSALSAANDAVDTADAAAAAAAAITGAFTPSYFTAKGQIITATGNGTAAYLSVGANGRVLEADSSQVGGVKWGRKITNSATAPPLPSTGDLWLQTT